MIECKQVKTAGRVANRKVFVAMEEMGTAEASPLLREAEVKEITQAAETVSVPRTAHTTRDGRPDPEWVRGRCPECGDDLVSNMYYVGGQGYLVVWECWGSLGEDPRCEYRRVL